MAEATPDDLHAMRKRVVATLYEHPISYTAMIASAVMNPTATQFHTKVHLLRSLMGTILRKSRDAVMLEDVRRVDRLCRRYSTLAESVIAEHFTGRNSVIDGNIVWEVLDETDGVQGS